MVKSTISVKVAAFLLLGFFLGSPFFAYAKPAFRPDPATFENIKSILLKEQAIENPDKWRLFFVFRVKGEYRPKFFSSKQEYDTEVKVTVEESAYREKAVYKGVIDFPRFTRMFILQKNDLTPLYSIEKEKYTDYKFETFFSKEEIRLKTIDNGSLTVKSIQTIDMKEYYESRFLPFILAGFTFDSKGAQFFNLFRYSNSKHYQFEVRCLGAELLRVPAGEFNTYKLRIRPTGYLSGFSQNFIWYRNSIAPYMVKGVKNIWWYLNETWELIKIGKEKK